MVWVWQSDDPAWTIDLTAERDARKYLFGPLLKSRAAHRLLKAICVLAATYCIFSFFFPFLETRVILSLLSCKNLKCVAVCVPLCASRAIPYDRPTPSHVRFTPTKGGATKWREREGE